MGYIYILGTLIFTVYGQMILKWRIMGLNFELPQGKITDIALGFFKLIIDPFILSGFISAFIASIFWIMAMTKFEISFAYPFMSLAPALVFVLGMFFLRETFTLGKLVGLGVITSGIIITVKL